MADPRAITTYAYAGSDPITQHDTSYPKISFDSGVIDGLAKTADKLRDVGSAVDTVSRTIQDRTRGFVTSTTGAVAGAASSIGCGIVTAPTGVGPGLCGVAAIAVSEPAEYGAGNFYDK